MQNTSENNQPIGDSVPAQIVNPPLDWFLQALVSLANSGIETGVTLSVGGFLISGFLVSGKRYFEYIASDESLAGLNEDYRESVSKYYLTFGSIYGVQSDNENPPLPTFLHLRGARYFHHAGKAIPTNSGIWWRGRLSEIQGFSIGTLSAGD
jgi:hypothetical protein